MTYFLPVSVGTFTKGLGFSDLAPKLAALAVFIPALTHSEPAAAAQAGTLGEGHCNASTRKHLLARHQGIAQLPQRFRAAGAGHLCVLARHHRAGAKQFAGSAQCVDRYCRRGPFGTVASHRARLLAALFPDAAADRRARHRPVDEQRTVYLRDRHPAEFPAGCSRQAPPRDPARCRRDRDGAGGPRSRLRAADHHDRDRRFSHPRGGQPRWRRSISSCASPSTRMSRQHGSPA